MKRIDDFIKEEKVTLPLLSTIGRGPRGKGVYAATLVDTENKFQFVLKDWDTDEVVYSSPNLSSGKVYVDNNILYVDRGGSVKSFPLEVRDGEPGGRLFVCTEKLPKGFRDLYTVPVTKLNLYNRSVYPSRPDPREGDAVYFISYDADGTYISMGTVMEYSSENNTGCVFYGSSYIQMPTPQLVNGEWYLDGEPTGVMAQGPKGDKGEKGAKGDKGERGAQGERGPRGYNGLDGAKGDKGDTGAKGDPGEPGRDGKSLAIQPGVYTVFDLPDFDTTGIGVAFIVDDRTPDASSYPQFWTEDTDYRMDLYIRGRMPIESTVWTVVEDFQGPVGRRGLNTRFYDVDEDGVYRADIEDYVEQDVTWEPDMTEDFWQEFIAGDCLVRRVPILDELNPGDLFVTYVLTEAEPDDDDGVWHLTGHTLDYFTADNKREMVYIDFRNDDVELADVVGYIDANKNVIVFDSENHCYYQLISKTDSRIAWSYVDGNVSRWITLTENSGWTVGQTHTLEETTNKVKSTGTWDATSDTKYATLKAIDARIDSKVLVETNARIAADALDEKLSNKLKSSDTWANSDTRYPTTAAVSDKFSDMVSAKEDSANKLPSDHAWVSNDTYFPTTALVAEFGNNNYEQLSNKQSSNTTWSSSDTLYPTTAAVDNRVASSVSGKEDANNKLDSNHAWNSNDTYYPTTAAVAAFCNNNYEKSSNKLYSTATWVSDNTKYPTTKAVDNRFQASSYRNTSSQTWQDSDNYYPSNKMLDSRANTLIENKLNYYNFQEAMYKNTSTGAWIDSDDFYPSNKAVDARIQALASGGIFWVTRGTTTADEITAAITAGKLPVCVYNQQFYVYEYTDSCHNFGCSKDATTHYYMWIQKSNSSWSGPTTKTFQVTENMKTSSQTWSSDDTHYPSCLAVENKMSSFASGKEDKSNKTLSTDIWPTDDTHYPSTAAAQAYVQSYVRNALNTIPRFSMSYCGAIPVGIKNRPTSNWEIKHGTMSSGKIGTAEIAVCNQATGEIWPSSKVRFTTTISSTSLLSYTDQSTHIKLEQKSAQTGVPSLYWGYEATATCKQVNRPGYDFYIDVEAYAEWDGVNSSWRKIGRAYFKIVLEPSVDFTA